MTKGVGSFAAGLEGLAFVEKLSERFEMPPRSVVRIACVVAGVVAVVLIWFICTQGKPVTEAPQAQENSDTVLSSSTEFDERPAATLAEATEASQPHEVVVYVTGAVASPGLYQLQTDDRIGDAVQAAGGLLPEAATAVVNLAQLLTDGMQIHIPRSDEVSTNAPVAGTAGTASSADSAAQTDSSAALVNINTADSALLQTLNGVGPATAQKILDYRTAHGPFQNKEELKNVSGIGEKKYAAIEAHITV